MYRPKMVIGKLRTNKPIEVLKERYKGQGLTEDDFRSIEEANKLFDGLEVYLSLWDYDKHSSYHLSGWDDAIDETIMMAIYHMEQTAPMPIYIDSKEDFIRDWKSGNYEPPCALTFDKEDVEEITVLREESEDGKVQNTASK